MFFKVIGICIIAILLMSVPAYAEYPEKPIAGIIPFGAGGGTDISSRMLAPLASEILGQTIIMQNKPGATGAIGLTTVANLPADGYALLFTAENPNLYKVLGLSKLDYSNFEPVLLSMSNPGLIVVPKNSPFNTFQELVSAVQSGKKLSVGTAGPGSLAHVAALLIQKVHNIKFNHVHFDGEGPGVTAMMGRHIDGMAVGLISASPYIKSGAVKALAVLSDKRLEAMPDIPAITECYDGAYDSYMPWGPFYGVYVKKGTPEPILNSLQNAFTKTANTPQFKDFVSDMGGIWLGITGDQAKAYIARNQSISAWLLYDTGGAKFSPEQFDIKRIETKTMQKQQR